MVRSGLLAALAEIEARTGRPEEAVKILRQLLTGPTVTRVNDSQISLVARERTKLGQHAWKPLPCIEPGTMALTLKISYAEVRVGSGAQ